MSNYTKFKIEAERNDTQFKVLVKGWFGWKSGFVYTNYFLINYDTLEAAKEAVAKYKLRFTEEES